MTRSDYRKPWKCGCDKLRWPNEAAAINVAGHAEHDYGVPIRAYKCPGHSCWHTASRGFHPRALRSVHRLVAWWAITRPIDQAWLAREIGRADGLGRPDRKFRRAVTDLARAGLITVEGGRLHAADPAGLLRVCAVGWTEWSAEQAAVGGETP